MKVAIVEDHLMFREVLRKVCSAELGHTVVGEADDGACAVEMLRRTTPDLLLLDLGLPSLDGLSVIENVRNEAPALKIIIISSHCDEFTVYTADRLRVKGFIDKNTNSVEALKAAIAAVAAGRTWFSEQFIQLKAKRFSNPQSFDKLLTPREQTVLSLVGVPHSDKEISARLGISAKTVEKHRFNILWKLGLSSGPELVRYAQQQGFTLASASNSTRKSVP